MKITEYIRNIKVHTKTNLRHLHSDGFYAAFDKAFGIQALEVQTSETEKQHGLAQYTTYPKHDISRTSGVFYFSPEKTRGAEEPISISSAPQLLGQGGFNTLLSLLTPLPTLIPPNDKARTDHSGQLPIYGPLAQPGQSARRGLPQSLEVAGSNPAGAFRTCSSNGRAPHLQCGGFGFKSQRAHSKITVMQGAKP